MDTVIDRLRICARTGRNPMENDLLAAVRRLERFQNMCSHPKGIAAPGCVAECELCGKLMTAQTQAQQQRAKYFRDRSKK